jgi:hypothetical protein
MCVMRPLRFVSITFINVQPCTHGADMHIARKAYESPHTRVHTRLHMQQNLNNTKHTYTHIHTQVSVATKLAKVQISLCTVISSRLQFHLPVLCS